MANDKDFLLKNAVEVGGPTKVTLGSITSSDIDLATGNYFADTPSGTSTYTISNAGDVQSFQLEVTGGTAEVAQNFSTTLYDGTGAEQTITNGIDLAGDGGIVWVKCRSDAASHRLIDTDGGANNILTPNDSSAYFNNSTIFSSFNSNGFSVATDVATNGSGRTYVSWSFKKEPSFFDVVTYSGDGTTDRQIAHSLGISPGLIIVKTTNVTDNWLVYHRGLTQQSFAGNVYTHSLALNGTSAEAQTISFRDNAQQTDSVFTLGYTGANTNEVGKDYVAYLFAHDDAADGLIQCGSFTTDGSSDASVTLGWEPQWILYKSTADGSWSLYDSVRGLDAGSGQLLLADSSIAEISGTGGIPTSSTGFTVNTGETNTTYIYIAIRAASDLDLTWPSSIEWAGGVAPSAPATGETDVFTLSTDDGGTSYVGVKTADNLS